MKQNTNNHPREEQEENRNIFTKNKLRERDIAQLVECDDGDVLITEM